MPKVVAPHDPDHDSSPAVEMGSQGEGAELVAASADERAIELEAFLMGLPDDALPQLWAHVMRQLRSRGLVRSWNNPVADIGERLAAEFLGLTLAGGVTQGYDAVDASQTRYQIKSHRRTSRTRRTRRIGVVRKLDDREFNHLIAMIFSEDLAIAEIWRIPYDAVVEHAKWVDTLNGHRLSAAVWSDPRVARLYP